MANRLRFGLCVGKSLIADEAEFAATGWTDNVRQFSVVVYFGGIVAVGAENAHLRRSLGGLSEVLVRIVPDARSERQRACRRADRGRRSHIAWHDLAELTRGILLDGRREESFPQNLRLMPRPINPALTVSCSRRPWKGSLVPRGSFDGDCHLSNALPTSLWYAWHSKLRLCATECTKKPTVS